MADYEYNPFTRKLDAVGASSGSSGSSAPVDITTAALQTAITGSTLVPGQNYNITGSTYGGSVVVQASSNNKVTPTGTWLRNTNLPGFGWVRLTGGAAGSVDTLTVNAVNQMTASVPFATSLNQTATNVAANINANGAATYTAVAILDTIVVYQKTASAAANGHVVTATTTTITTGFLQNISNGANPTLQNLQITYDAVADKIRSCHDPVLNNKMYISEYARTLITAVEPFNAFRWGDPVFQGNTMDNAWMGNMYIASSAPCITGNQILENSAIFNVVGINTCFIFYNTLKSTFTNAGAGITNTLLLGTNAYLGRFDITNIQFDGNILSGANSFWHRMFGSPQNGSRVNNNILSGSASQVQGLNILAGTVQNNTLSGGTANIWMCTVNAFNTNGANTGGGINLNTLSSANASIRDCVLMAEGASINSNTISATNFANPTIRYARLNGAFSTINSNTIAFTNGGTLGITSCVLNGPSSAINSMNLNVASGIFNLTLDAPSAIFTGYTFDATFTTLYNVNWTNDNRVIYNSLSPTLTGAANLGANGSDIRVGLLPVAKMYLLSAVFEGSGLVGVGASVNAGIETDSATAILPVTAITGLNQIVTTTVTTTKTAAANRRIIAQTTGANVTAGTFQLTLTFKISNY